MKIKTFGTVTLAAFGLTALLAATPAYAGGYCEPEPREKGNNGVGNGVDPQPPGNPPVNDGPGTGPGNPGNRGGNK